MKFYLWNKYSEGGTALAKALGAKRIKHVGKPIRTGVLVNWGASNITRDIRAGVVLNKPDAVKRASDKLQAFRTLSGYVCIPHFTESLVEASRWLLEGDMVVCRTVLNGHGGNGIILASTEAEMVKATLYTRYIKKQNEYRVHVFNSKMIHKQRKARRLDVPDEEVNWKVRNHENGFIFQIEDFDMPEDCEKQSVEAVKVLGLDFGAVDVIYNANEQRAYVLEVNSAPGLSGTTLDKYVEAFDGV
jgi:glutathione synthase/RimK-type ligase-like ATP-grasp enzyme